ncbi:MAG: hypothetical protein JWM44_2289 [Bacilli bacterium]|nr:hypothetical protein [Bacilli bacterium]
MSEDKMQFEIFRDPFRMLLQLIELVCETQGLPNEWTEIPAYENNTFVLNPNKAPGQGNRPNFIFKKDQTEISWYQTLGRDISCTKDLSRSEYNKMFVECMASLYNL